MKPAESYSLQYPSHSSPPPHLLSSSSLLPTMKMSCNGCRILRKGCSDTCILRPCLQWIASPDAQANATLFLAKFYGRAGLINLIEAGPDQVRPAIFRSLIYEACGRVVNPVEGAMGLMWSGKWDQCQAAVDAVFQGKPILKNQSVAAADGTVATTPVQVDPLKTCDIRHVAKVDTTSADNSNARARNRIQIPMPAPETLAPSGSGSSFFSNVTEESPVLNPVNRGEVGIVMDLTLGLAVGPSARW